MEFSLDKRTPTVLECPLTEAEAAILDAAAFVQYGVLLKVSIDTDLEPAYSRQVTPSQMSFVKIVRDEGLAHLDTVVVHNGEPSQIEIDGTHGTIKYRRKIRFN